MDEGGGNILIDHSGNNNNANIQSPASLLWVNGVNNLALKMNGTKNSHGAVPHNSTLSFNNAITISAWVRPSGLSGKRIIAKTNPDGFELGLNANGKFEFRFNRETNNTTYRFYSNQNYPTDGNTWIHVSVTFDGQKSAFYIDGNPDNQIDYGSALMRNNTSELQIGARNSIDRWVGEIDDLKLYNRALSSFEIKLILGIELPLPDSPILLSPENETILSTQSPTLTWGIVPSASSYFIQVSYSSIFDDIVFEQEISQGISINVPTLEVGSDYFWRVLAKNESGESEWSTTWSFTIPTPNTDPGDESLIGYWKLDDGPGNVMTDYSGKENHASILAPTSLQWINGKYGLALRMNGTKNSNGTVPHNPTLNTSSGITISAWIRPNLISGKRFFSKTNPNGFELGTNLNGKIEFRFNRESNGTTYRLLSNQNYPTNGNAWIHVAATFDGTKSTIFINGVPDNSAIYQPVSIVQNNSDLQIGARNGIDRWSGDLDEIMLFNKALSNSEIFELFSKDAPLPSAPQLLSPSNGTLGLSTNPTLSWSPVEFAESYQLQVSASQNFNTLLINQINLNQTGFNLSGLSFSTQYYWRVAAVNVSGQSPWSESRSFTTISNSNTNLVGHWKMNEGTGIHLIDNSTFGNNASFVNGTGIQWVAGKENQAVRFDGLTGRFARVSHNSSLNITSQLTISVWIKPTALANRQILSKYGPDGFELSTFEGGQIEFRLNRDSNGSTYRLRTNQTYPTNGNTWVHVVAVFNGSSSTIYINGVQNVSANYGNIQINPNTADLQIGARNSVNRWVGDMDDLRLYNNALTAAEIQQVYQENLNLRISNIEDKSAELPKVTNMQNSKEINKYGELEIKAFPNPFDEYLNLQLNAISEKEILVTIYDSKGIELFRNTSIWNSNLQMIYLSPEKYPPGIYFAVVWKEGKPFRFNLLKK